MTTKASDANKLLCTLIIKDSTKDLVKKAKFFKKNLTD